MLVVEIEARLYLNGVQMAEQVRRLRPLLAPALLLDLGVRLVANRLNIGDLSLLFLVDCVSAGQQELELLPFESIVVVVCSQQLLSEVPDVLVLVDVVHGVAIVLLHLVAIVLLLDFKQFFFNPLHDVSLDGVGRNASTVGLAEARIEPSFILWLLPSSIFLV